MTWIVYDPADGGRVLRLDHGDEEPEGCVSAWVDDVPSWPAPPAPGRTLCCLNETLIYVDRRSLSQAKDAQWAQIKAARDAAEFGGFVWDGSTFDSDDLSRSRIMGAVQMAVLAMGAGQSFSIGWTLADNSERTMSAADMIAVGLALGTHVATAHATARALRTQINAAQTNAAVEAVTWPA